jgi:hypothetical protein
MDRDHLLIDVFELAVEKVRSGASLSQALTEAEREVIENRTRLMQGTIRSERRLLVKMLEKHKATGQPVKIEW